MLVPSAPARRRLSATKAWSLVLANPAIVQPLALHGIAHLLVEMLSPLVLARHPAASRLATITEIVSTVEALAQPPYARL